MGAGRTAEHQDELGFFIQDSSRLRQNLTINPGLRWQLALPFQADRSTYSIKAARNPNPGAAVNALFSDATFRANLATAGLSRNFFVLNPDVTNAMITTNRGFTSYDRCRHVGGRAEEHAHTGHHQGRGDGGRCRDVRRMAPSASGCTSFAKPKSNTFTVPSARTLMLAGFRSR